MSDGVFEDYTDMPMSATAPGLPGRWFRAGGAFSRFALPGALVVASSVVVGLGVAHWRAAPAPSQRVAEQTSKPPQTAAVNPFGGVGSGRDLLRLDSVSPAEAGVFGSLSPFNPSSGSAPVASARLESNDIYGGLAELRPSVSSRDFVLRPAFNAPYPDSPPLPPVASSGAPEVAANVPAEPPLPPRRPSDLAAPVPVPPAATPASAPAVASVAPSAPAPKLALPDVSGIVSHLFTGTGQATATSAPATPNNRTVAYAAPETTSIARMPRDNPLLRNLLPSAPSGALARYDKFTAVYDIEARVVYMPDGTRLEAHSGYGDLKDDPKRVSVPARGATPPDVYELTMRESLFHGVEALRLKPVGAGEQYGRSGFLAHPYMLGPDGDSNGCVSLKDYDAFLNAYKNGQIKKLVVVAKLD